MRGITRRWVFRCGPGAGNRETPLPQRVLEARGLSDPERARLFLSPRLVDLHDPSLIPDLDLAAERLLEAVRRRERIVIYGDYDVDGVTATAILYHALKAIDPESDLATYVPHRIDEGYGLNSEAVTTLAEEGARVIVSVDCGITAIEPAATAREAGVDLIVTDHHNPPASLSDLPPAFAVVHPRRPDSEYPFGHLCGAGVAYKLAWRIATMHCGGEGAGGGAGGRVTPALRNLLVELLAFAALGSVADIVPLVDENRVLARFGLGRIGQTSNSGLRALLETSGLLGADVDSYAAGFRLAPRLNAAGRLNHAREAVELFTTATGSRAVEIAARLTEQNQQRQSVEKTIAEQACEAAEQAGLTTDERRAIVLADAGWHPGVIGIVCSRLVERYCRPTILLQRDGDTCRGSGRSIEGFNLHDALVQCRDLLTKFGGHDMAAGLSLPATNLEAFAERFTAIANAAIPPERLMHEVAIDALTTLDELLPETVAELEKMAPFGPGNPAVYVLVRGAEIASPPRLLGKTGKHASLHLKQNRYHMRAVAWGWGERAGELRRGTKLDIVVRPQLSRFDGRVRVEPEVKDLRPVESHSPAAAS